MSSKSSVSKLVSVDEQAYEHEAAREEYEAYVDETPELRATVELEIQAKVDANHPAGIVDTSEDRIYGVTLAQEERIRAREEELERISARGEFGTQTGRERRTRRAVSAASRARREEFGKRAASVDPWADPDRADPRELLTRDELGVVNEQAMRLAQKHEGWTRAAISRRLAERVVDGEDLMSAILEVVEELETAPGTVIPIAKVGEVPRREVSIAGTVCQLWEPSHHRIQQVGLLEDESGRIKFTIWRKSRQSSVREGEVVRFRNVSRSWYQGRPSVAVTGWSRLEFPERGRWWE
ncbi:DNA-binding protein [Natronobiforma cellulositropha]|uniref:DNA-binding protein n=1 Tax=Natronobiforma cellulositropha TaxID=1679076 RepID=UPI0021D5CF84|nr:DNA-binding protein [Natronobiforma cellulositropha]